MSSMLEQAIVDAQALREAALKNAEQSLIEKFAPQIKEAVESLLEGVHESAKRKVAYEGQVYSIMEIDEGKATIQKEGQKPFVVQESELSEVSDELLQEEEMGMETDPAAAEGQMMEPFDELPYAHQDGETEVEYTIDLESPEFSLDFGSFDEEPQNVAPEQSAESYDDIAGELAPEQPAAEEPAEEDPLAGLELQEEDLVNEILNLMNEMDNDGEEILEEELIVDTSMQKNGTFETNESTLQYMQELELARMEGDKHKEENDELLKKIESLDETVKKFTHKNKQYKDAVEKLSNKLNETFLSNAKLLYSNRTLSDASLNERQKTKIVDAIAKARTPDEAKNLCEALNATVTSGNEKRSPRTLSESVQRKSNLSGILPRRNRQADESESHTFADKMKKLAGIK